MVDKKIPALFVSALLLLSACAQSSPSPNGGAPSNESTSSVSASQDSAEVSSEEVTSSSTAPVESGKAPQSESASSKAVSRNSSSISANEDSEYYFRDGVLKTDRSTLKITDYKVIQAGEKGNEYGDGPIIAFWYTVTNDSDEFVSAYGEWVRCFTAIQDNNPNIVNKLDSGSHPDEQLSDTDYADIKPGGSIENAKSYELSDLETPVTLKATFKGDELGEQTFNIDTSVIPFPSDATDLDSSSDTKDDTPTSFNVDWEKCAEQAKTELTNKANFPYVNDVYIRVDEDKKIFTAGAMLDDSTDPAISLEFAETMLRRFNDLANSYDSNVALAGEDSYGGLYDLFTVVIGVAPQSAANDQNNWFVNDAIVAGTQTKHKLNLTSAYR